MESDLDKKSVVWAFLLGLALTVIMPTMAPSWHLTYFAPVLIIALYQKSLGTCMLLAISCGTVLDMFASFPTFGLHAAAYVTAVVALYPQRRHVFADSPTTLPLMTALFSSLSCGVLGGLLHIFDIANVFSWLGIATDMILMPIADGAVAFALYILPALLFGKRRRTGNEYFLSRKS